ncbi:MAG: CPBP family intramembrane metalloprotease, partial [Clostridia bacterium]|nr:CPBP family intramembrane metalloprotease [Clostridia bacterium]
MKKSSLFNAQLIYFIALIMFVLMRILVLVFDVSSSSASIDLIINIFIQVGIMFLFPILAFSKTQKQKVKTTFKDFNYSKISLISLVICVLIGFLCYFLNITIASFFGSIIRMLGYESAPSVSSGQGSSTLTIMSFLLEVFTVAILPAVCEETMHRGLLLKGYSSLGIKKAIILSSILFGLMHLNINQFFYATILGFIIALSVIISKNIFPAIIIHFMNNFLSVYFTYATTNNWFGSKFYKFMTSFVSHDNLITFFATNVVLLLLILTGIVVLFAALLKQTRVKKVKTMLKDIADINKEYETNQESLQQDQNLANLYNLNTLMSQYNIKSLNSMVFTELEIKTQKATAYEKILIISTIILGGIVTAFT